MAGLVYAFALWAAPWPAPGAEPDVDGVVSTRGEEYVIGMDDVLNIVVWRNEAFSRTVRVRPDGKITLPLIDEITAAGVTPSGLRRVITQLLAEYVDNPKVSVIVQEINSAKITILGEVRKPGIYPLKAHMTMFDAVALAEGFSDFASPNHIMILRNHGGTVTRIKVKFFEAAKGAVDIDQLMLETGDTILVP
jgi:polysaccharide export outer membrane protein